jgi:voltage-gated potassium channel
MKRAPASRPWQFKLHEVIFEAETPAGKHFDLVLIILIMASVAVILMESVSSIHQVWAFELKLFEWIFTVLFSIELILRLLCLAKPLHYVGSFYGMVDFLSILPTWLSLFIPGTQVFSAIRILRVMRVFRILKLIQFIGEADSLRKAVWGSLRKITVFMMTIVMAVILLGAIMYLVEGPEHGFTSIPKSIYWSIVTMTTVGYGDISPQTPLGQMIASLMMLIGYGVLAVPTGIVTVEMSKVKSFKHTHPTRSCTACSLEGHDNDARYCKACGTALS